MTHSTTDDSTHRSRGWICTLNNYTEAELAKVITFADEKTKYSCIGKEVGKTGTPHLQIYFQMKTSYAGQSIKNQTSKRMWCGIANSPDKSRKYCQKEGDYMEFGTIDLTATGKAGQKKTAAVKGGAATQAMWKALDNDIQDGYKETEIMSKYPHLYFKHHGGIARGITISNKIPVRKDKTCVHAYIGPPGCGKTTKAQELAGQDSFFYNSPNKIWWSGYDGTQAVVLDDFHGNYPFTDWKQLTDKYPHRVPVHNGMINFNASKIIITSNLMPGEWWKDDVLGTHGYSALLRRLNVLQVWDDNAKDFVDTDLQDRCWNEGCVCDPKFAETAPTPIILSEEDEPEPVVLQRQTATLDLSQSSFLDDIRDRVPMDSLSPPPLPKRRRLLKDLPGKSVGKLTAQMNEMYPDPFEVATQSSEDDPIDSFDSCSSDSDSMSDDLSEEF